MAEVGHGGSDDGRERWADRMRANAVDALRYTRFVTWMRRALPVAAIAILGVVVAYAMFPSNSERLSLSTSRVETIDDDLAMQKPRLTGVDAKGNPYVITAETAAQQGRNSRKVALSKVDADLTYGGDKWANANAGRGFIDLDAHTLHLAGGIALYTDSGYELHTERAFADLKRNVVEGDAAVSGHGPLGSVRADSFRIDRSNGSLSLRGHVKGMLVPKRMKR